MCGSAQISVPCSAGSPPRRRPLPTGAALITAKPCQRHPYRYSHQDTRLWRADTGPTLGVSIATPARTITTAPATLSFTYTAFGAAKTASSTFQPTCTIYLPYTNVAQRQRGCGCRPELHAGFEHFQQRRYGRARQYRYRRRTNVLRQRGYCGPAQAGTCVGGSCTADNTHTLTITY